MYVTRRNLLRTAGSVGPVLALGAGLRNVAFGAAADEPILVIVHMRGGCDGLNLVSPANDPDFIAARAAELRVSGDGPDAGHALDNGLDAKTDFRLHAGAVELSDLYRSKYLAVVHAAGLTDANRSHFVATDMIERGVGRTAALARTSSGWIARRLNAEPHAAGVVAVCAGNALSSDFDGYAKAVAVPNLDGGLNAPGGPEAAAVLIRLYARPTTPVAAVGADALRVIHDIDGRLRDDKGHVIPYKPAADVAYEKAGGFGAGLRTVAQLIKLDLGLKVAGVEIGGWDTHEYQPGRFKNCVEQLSRGIGSFWNDLAAYHDRLVVVALTEFGRRLRSNRSSGTDHGRGGVMLVLGGGIAGGRMYGRWPGLNSAALEEGVDLAVTTDYRTVLSEVTQGASSARAADRIFPEFQDTTRLGLFRALG